MKRLPRLFLLLFIFIFVRPAFAQLPPINGVAGPTTSRQLGSIITNPFGSPSTGDRLLFATPANSGVLVTSGGGVPSISSTLPSFTAPIVTVTSLAQGPDAIPYYITSSRTNDLALAAVSDGSSCREIDFGTPSSVNVGTTNIVQRFNMRSCAPQSQAIINSFESITFPFPTAYPSGDAFLPGIGAVAGTTTAVFTGSMSGTTTLTVSAVTSGALAVGNYIIDTTVTDNHLVGGPVYIVSQLTGPAGGVGTYQMSYAQTLTSMSLTAKLPPGIDLQSPGIATLRGGPYNFAANVSVGAGNSVSWSGRSKLFSTLDGTILLTNNAVSGATGIYYGGTSVGNILQLITGTLTSFRLGDNSGDAPIAAGVANFSGVTTLATGLVLTSPGDDTALTDATLCRVTSTGAVKTGTGVAGICLGTSTESAKEDIEPLTSGLDKIMKLRPVSYRYDKEHGGEHPRLQYWFTAERMDKDMPELVHRDVGGRPISVDGVAIIPFLVNGMKELKAANDNLRDEIDILKRAAR